MDCDTLRLELLPDTLRLELEPAALRLVLLLPLDTLRLELLPDTLRLADEPDTLRFELLATLLSEDVAVPTVLEATELDVRLTLRLLLEANAAVRSVLRLRFLSHPPLLILRLGVK